MRARARAYEQDDFGAYAMSLVLVVAMAVAWMLAAWPESEPPPAPAPHLVSLDFQWWSAWGDPIAIVQLDWQNGERVLYAGRWWSPRAEVAGEAGRIVEGRLSFDSWAQVENTLEAIGYWELEWKPTGGMDGSTCFVRSVGDRGAKAVMRWECDQVEALRDLLFGISLLDTPWHG